MLPVSGMSLCRNVTWHLVRDDSRDSSWYQTWQTLWLINKERIYYLYAIIHSFFFPLLLRRAHRTRNLSIRLLTPLGCRREKLAFYPGFQDIWCWGFLKTNKLGNSSPDDAQSSSFCLSEKNTLWDQKCSFTCFAISPGRLCVVTLIFYYSPGFHKLKFDGDMKYEILHEMNFEVIHDILSKVGYAYIHCFQSNKLLEVLISFWEYLSLWSTLHSIFQQFHNLLNTFN